MRIAVIFFGQPRNLQNPLSSWSHKWWLRGNEVDYYGHCWFSKEPSTEYTVGENVLSSRIEPQAIEILRKKYPNIILKIEEPKIFRLSDYLPENTEQLKKNLRMFGENELKLLPVYISQFYSIHQSLKLFDSYVNKKKYDFIVISRYDNFISYIPKPNRIVPDKLNLKKRTNSGFPDLLFIGSRELINAIDVYPELKNLLGKVKTHTPEKLKEECFLSHFPQSRLNENFFEILAIRDSRIFIYVNYFIRVRLSKISKFIFSKSRTSKNAA